MLARGLVGVLRLNIDNETSDNGLTQIWFNTCFNNLIRRTVFFNRQGRIKNVNKSLFFMKSNTSVTPDCRMTDVDSCWFLFIPSFLIKNNLKNRRPQEMKRAGKRNICLQMIAFFTSSPPTLSWITNVTAPQSVCSPQRSWPCLTLLKSVILG